MIRKFAASLLCVLSGLALAQTGIEDPSAEIEDWLVSESAALAELRRMESAEPGTLARGTLRVISLSELSAPASLKEQIVTGARKHAEGAITALPGAIPSNSEIVSSLGSDRAARSKPIQPTFEPADLALTPLEPAHLIASQASGVIYEDGTHTGLARYFLIPGLGIVQFNEDDYVAAGTDITLVAESLNTEVNEVPAMSWTAFSPEGRGKATLSWVTPSRAFRLVLVTDDSKVLDTGADFLLDVATRIRQ